MVPNGSKGLAGGTSVSSGIRWWPLYDWVLVDGNQALVDGNWVLTDVEVTIVDIGWQPEEFLVTNFNLTTGNLRPSVGTSIWCQHDRFLA